MKKRMPLEGKNFGFFLAAAKFGVGVVVFLTFTAAAGCGTFRKMGTVADKTEEMNQTTKEMSGETKKMREETEKMRADTELMRLETERMRLETERMRIEIGIQTEAASAAGNRAADAGNRAADAGNRAADAGLIAAKAGENAAAAGNNAASTSQDIYRDSRQGDGVTVRAKRLESMDAHRDVEAKISEAGVFFKAFEFQLWKGRSFDTEAKREVLFNEAVLSFFSESHAYVDYSKALSVSGADNKTENMMALSVAMHILNSTQEELVEKSKQMSMYQLVTQSLALKSKVEWGDIPTSSLLPWQKTVLEKEKEAILLLQARANFPAAMVLSKISKVHSTTLWGLTGFFSKVTNLMGTWQPDLADRNQVELEAYVEWLDIAIASRQFLENHGFDPSTDLRVVNMLRNMNRDVENFKGVSGVKKLALDAFFNKVECFSNKVCD